MRPPAQHGGREGERASQIARLLAGADVLDGGRQARRIRFEPGLGGDAGGERRDHRAIGGAQTGAELAGDAARPAEASPLLVLRRHRRRAIDEDHDRASRAIEDRGARIDGGQQHQRDEDQLQQKR